MLCSVDVILLLFVYGYILKLTLKPRLLFVFLSDNGHLDVTSHVSYSTPKTFKRTNYLIRHPNHVLFSMLWTWIEHGVSIYF